jgi:hypothetical protein
MSQQLISLNPDLKRLADEGHDVSIVGGYVIVRHIPYLTKTGTVSYGILGSTYSGATTLTQTDHTAVFVGDFPCDINGRELDKLINQKADYTIADGLVAKCMFSAKKLLNGSMVPYVDFHEKFTTYIAKLAADALYRGAIDPRRHNPLAQGTTHSVFNYADTASSRANIVAVTRKLEHHRIAIIGLGGSGAYVLDFVAKTPVTEIALFDGDLFQSHNAFRAPGAASEEDLELNEPKVAYFARKYSNMHRHITANAVYVDASNVALLKKMNFVFLCIDKPSAKVPIIAKLEEYGISFVDVGMGIYERDGQLHGTLRITTSSADERKAYHSRVNLANATDDDYVHNIQIAELNAMCAVFAVIRWKKSLGFYADLEGEHHSTLMLNGNSLTNEFPKWPDNLT